MSNGPDPAAGGADPTGAHPTDPTGAGEGDHPAGPEPGLDGFKVAAARLWATNRYPYLASALFASPVLPAAGLGRVAVDRWWRVLADPAAVDAATVAELGGELLHLCAHLLRDHAGRADEVGLGQPAELHHWVDAADAEIADDFPADQPRVSPTVRPEDLGAQPARLAEEYYRSGQVRDGSDTDCGSGAHGQPGFAEPPPPPERDPDRRATGGVQPHEADAIRRRVADEVARAGGQAPPGLRAWAAGIRQPRIDWRRELAAVLRRSLAATGGAVDYSYQRPSRRASAVAGVVLPALRQPEVEVAVVCDTSASVDEVQLALALTEIDGVLRATGVRSVRVLACDDAVHTANRVTRGRDVTLIGGGGTDMGTGLMAALAARPAPQVVVVLTDGFTPWPGRPPRADVIVGLLAAPEPVPAPPDPPGWTRVVPIPRSGSPADGLA